MCAYTQFHGMHSEQKMGLIILPHCSDGSIAAAYLEGAQVRGKERISGKIGSNIIHQLQQDRLVDIHMSLFLKWDEACFSRKRKATKHTPHRAENSISA